MSSVKIARREFIKQMTGLGSLFGLSALTQSQIATSAMSGLFKKAFAGSLNVDHEKHYVHLSLPGAPPRWLLDLPIFAPTTSTTPANIVAPGFGFHLNGNEMINAGASAYYRHAQGGQNYFLPPIWRQAAAGKNFSGLLDNMMIIRGMDAEIAAHDLANGRQVAPIIHGVSVSGLVADASLKPIPGVGSGCIAANAFRSVKGLAAVGLQGTNPLSILLAAFKPTNKTVSYREPAYAQVREQAIEQFEDYAKSLGYTDKALTASYESALNLIKNGTYSLQDQFAPTLKKYQETLVDQAISYEAMCSIFTSRISPSANLLWNRVAQNDVFAGTATTDLRDSFKQESNRKPNAPNMATQFAVMELLILNNITPVFTGGFGGLTGLTVPYRDRTNANAPIRQVAHTNPHDQHFIGTVPSILFTTAFYRAFLTCLVEFVDQLKTANKFDKTMIHIASEFNRKPRPDGSGSDHGSGGSGTSLISGMFNSFQMTGNIRVNSVESSYPGSWGDAATYANFTRPIQVNDVAASIAVSFFGAEDPVKSGLVTNFKQIFNSQGKLLLPSEVKNV